MEKNKQNQRIVDLLNEAQQAVIEAQGNKDPGKYQHAQNAIQEAKVFLQESFKSTNPEEETKVLHAKELLRHLEEAQHAIESTE